MGSQGNLTFKIKSNKKLIELGLFSLGEKEEDEDEDTIMVVIKDITQAHKYQKKKQQ